MSKLQDDLFIGFTEMQGHTVQRNTKAKKCATSSVGTLRLLTLSYKAFFFVRLFPQEIHCIIAFAFRKLLLFDA